MKKVAQIETSIHNFTQLSARHRRAIELKADGLYHKDIASRIEAEFTVACSCNTVNQWFAANGILQPAYKEYAHHMGNIALAEAGNLAKQAARLAMRTTIEIMLNSNDHKVRLQAAQAVMKIVPTSALVKSGD